MQLSLLTWQPPAPTPISTIGWSAEAETLLAKMYRESECPDVAEIARACGKSYAAISRANRLGLTSRSSDAKMRKCLGGCDRLFMSDNRGNRICMSCKSTEEYACA